MACCGDAPTLETMAAVSMLRKKLPELKVRVINVVDLIRLQDDTQHPHGMSQSDYDMLFLTGFSRYNLDMFLCPNGSRNWDYFLIDWR